MLPRRQPSRAVTCAGLAVALGLILLGVGFAWGGLAGLVIGGFLTLGSWTLLAAAATLPHPDSPTAGTGPVLRRPADR